MEQERFINFSQALEDSGVGNQVFAHFDEGANDIDTHGHRAWAVEDIGGHQRTVLGKGADLFGELKVRQDITVCDIPSISSRVSSKAKSSGNRSRLRLRA